MGLFLGIFPGHDSNVSLFNETGEPLFAINNGRLTRDKNSFSFPREALELIANGYGTELEVMVAIRMGKLAKVWRDGQFVLNAWLKGLGSVNVKHILQHYFSRIKKGRALEAGIREHAVVGLKNKRTYSVPHHHAHAASAYYSSGFDEAWVLSLDGQGDDGYSTTFFKGKGATLKLIKGYYFNELPIGRNYMLTTALVGLHGGRHPGKLTGLAAHNCENKRAIEDLRTFWNKVWRSPYKGDYLNYNDYLLYDKEGKKEMQSMREQYFADYSMKELAWAIQTLTEETVLDVIKKNIPKIKGTKIALAGGVVSNVRLNQKIKQLGFDEIFIQPAMGDEGLSFGAVQYFLGKELGVRPKRLGNVFLGPEFKPSEIRNALIGENVAFMEPADIADTVANLLAEGFVVARFDGKMEYGPRALGNRSILFKTDDPSVNDWLNIRLERTEYMPFAPLTLAEYAHKCYVDISGAEDAARFMTITCECSDYMKKVSPGVVLVDGTARPQLLSPADNQGMYAVLEAYHKKTGIPSLVNTSFNMHEEPIVCTPLDAIRSFRLGHLDYMAMGPFLIKNPDLKKTSP